MLPKICKLVVGMLLLSACTVDTEVPKQAVMANADIAAPFSDKQRSQAQDLIKISAFIQARAIGFIDIFTDQNLCSVKMVVKKTYINSGLVDGDRFTLQLPCAENPKSHYLILPNEHWIDSNQQLKISDLKLADTLEVHLIPIANKQGWYQPLAMPVIVRSPTNSPVSNPLNPGAEWERFVPQ